MAFENNVFVNCPFDQDYRKFLEPLLFSILSCGYEPRISETHDSGANRLTHIIDMVINSKFSIHDLSRMVANEVGELARFNMPFELGIDIGARNSGDLNLAQKKCLILDTHKYRYQAALSDIAGNDIEIYDSEIEVIIRCVRNWLSIQSGHRGPGPKRILEDFYAFKVDFQETLTQDGFSKSDINNLPKSEYISLASEWISAQRG